MALTDDPTILWTIAPYTLAILGGVVAGIVNTLAGNGSAITLPILMFTLGLDVRQAWGTNRVGVLLASLVGAGTFKQSGVLESKGILWMLVPTVVGATIGATVATFLDAEAMHWVIAIVMVFILVVVLTQPKRWIKQKGQKDLQAFEEVLDNPRKLSRTISFFFVGVYGGFIQMGVGFLLLAVLVLQARYDLVKANAIKVVIVMAFTIPALIIFHCKGMVEWPIGLLLAAGQCVGAWIAARFASRHPRADVWIRRLLIVMIIVVLIKLFGIDNQLVSSLHSV